MLGKDQNNKNFSLKTLPGQVLSLSALLKITLRRKVANWMMMKEYSEAASSTTELHYFTQ